MARPLSAGCGRAEAIFVAVVGPTGSGKSDIALGIAEGIGGEIVGCDALQVYRELDVGTAKLAPERRRGIPHHLIDVAPPDDEFSAARYIELAAPAVRDIHRRARVPIVVGGTGLYLRALRYGLFPGPGRDDALRARLDGLASRRGPEALYRVLTRWDPVSAERIHPRDRVRLVRALEVTIAAKEPMSALMPKRRSPLDGFEDILIGLRPPRGVLAERVRARVSAMYGSGLMDEAKRLVQRYGDRLPAFKAIGYRECLSALAGRIDLDEAKHLTETATMRYAKRQMTWFRKEEGIAWFDGLGDDPTVLEAVLSYLRQRIDDSACRRAQRQQQRQE